MRPILVNGTYKTAAFIAPVVLAALGCGLGLVVLLAGGPPVAVLVLLAVGLALAVVALVVGLRVAARRTWLVIDKDHFVVRDRGSEVEVADEDVTGLAWGLRHDFSTGVHRSSSHAGRIVFTDHEGRRREAHFSYKIPNRGDEVGPLLRRLLNRLIEQADEALNEGRDLAGDGWALSRDGLRLGNGDAAEVIPFDEMTSTAAVDGKVCVWVRGEAAASARVPLGSLNAQVLAQLLRWRIREQGAKENEEELEGGLGRIIFQRDKGLTRGGYIVLIAIGVFLILGGATILGLGLVLSDNKDDMIGAAVIAAIPALIGTAFVVGAGVGRVNVFRAHVLGLSRITWLGKKVLLYEDIGEFTWSATRVYVNGAYTGTRMVVRATPRPGVAAEPIVYRTNVKGNDAELDNLRDYVANVVGERLRKDVEAGRRVRWTDRLMFTADGVEHQPSALFGSRDRELIAYDEVSGYDFDAGVLRVFAGSDRPRFTVSVATPNFFPCLHVLLGMVKRERGPRHEEP
jgi:hypothetical protein